LTTSHMVRFGSPFQCLTYSLLILPPLLLTAYFLAAFPPPPEPVKSYPGLSSLSRDSKAWSIYPEDFYPNGAYVSLPFGKTRYWLMGPPESDNKIILIHGLSIPSLIWRDIAPSLAAQGYRVLLYDLYGRGYSDSPQTKYDSNLYVIQLALLMQHIKWDKAALVGVSMGGGIAASFVASFPDLVTDRVIIVASAGLVLTSDMSRTTRMMSLPLVQTLTSSSIAQKFLQYLTDSPNETTPVNPIEEIVRIQSAHLPGYNAAISSSLREGPIRGEYRSFSSAVWRSRKLLVIHGTNDNTVPYKYSSMIQAALPKDCQSEIITIEGGRHDLTISHPDLLVNQIDRWVRLI
jgi:pimeloyl-ACP methyl ester carboxylesterase